MRDGRGRAVGGPALGGHLCTPPTTELWADEQRQTGRKANLPGYHGKGFYSAQGRYVYANNGDHATAALTDPTVPSGVLAEWDGQADLWTVVRRNQFTEVTGPGGIGGNPPGKSLEHRFPDAFGAYWLRRTAEKDSTDTTTFLYE
jgi:hypothetical protein